LYPTFRRNVSPPSSGAKNSCHLLARWFAELFFDLLARWFAELFFDPEDGGDTFLRNVGYNSTDYTAPYPRRRYSSTLHILYKTPWSNVSIEELIAVYLLKHFPIFCSFTVHLKTLPVTQTQ
jgi:hypothetical protein